MSNVVHLPRKQNQQPQPKREIPALLHDLRTNPAWRERASIGERAIVAEILEKVYQL